MGTTAEKLSYLNETKQAIKTAIQDKGVAVADGDTFRSYADKITAIDTRPILKGTATAEQVLSGKTFYSQGYNIRTGTMTTLSNLTYDSIKTDSPTFTIPKGYHNGTTKVTLDGDYVCLPYVEWLQENLSDYTLAQLGWNGLRYVLPFVSRSEAYAAWKGQTLSITVSGQSCTARLVSSNYNGKDGLVFYVTGMTTQYPLFSSGSTTSGGWGSSTSFRNTLNGTIYNSLSDAVKVLLQTNTVPYGIGGAGKVTTIANSQDKLFVPSLKELKGNSNYLYNGSLNTDWQPAEGTQFEWFAEDVSRITPTSRTMTRSVPQSNRYCFIEANSTDAIVIWLTTATSVAFCFVI